MPKPPRKRSKLHNELLEGTQGNQKDLLETSINLVEHLIDDIVTKTQTTEKIDQLGPI